MRGVLDILLKICSPLLAIASVGAVSIVRRIRWKIIVSSIIVTAAFVVTPLLS